MNDLVRLGGSSERPVPVPFDHVIEWKGDATRSEAPRALIGLQSPVSRSPLDDDRCHEELVLKSRGNAVRTLADAMIGIKGMKQGELVMTTTGKRLH